jgi:hypothetical protein
MFNQEPSRHSPLPDVRPWYAPHTSEPVVVPTPDEVEESYRRQWYRLSAGGLQISLRPSNLEYNELWPEPAAAPQELTALWGRYVLTWWNQPDSPCSANQRVVQEALLAQLLADGGYDPQPIVMFAEDSKWAEPGVLIKASLEQAREAALTLGQQVIVRLDQRGATLIWLDGTNDHTQTPAEEVIPLEVRLTDQAPCPLSRGPEVSLPVKRQGGPGTSRGHSVAAMWQQFAQLTHQLVECEVHGGSKTSSIERGRAIALYEIAYPSRFSPMEFLHENPTGRALENPHASA